MPTLEEIRARFQATEEQLKAKFTKNCPGSYKDILVAALELILPESEAYGWPDLTKIHTIDDGDYQGTFLFLVAEKTYQPSTYWSFKVSYGSCSGCDTLERILCYDRENLSEQQIKDLWLLASHMFATIKEL